MTGSIEWMGNGQHEPATYGEDTGYLFDSYFHLIDVLKTHKSDGAIGDRVLKRQSGGVA